MTYDREELRLRFFEIAWTDRLERHARGGKDSQLKAAKEAADLATTAVDAFFAGGPFAVRKEPTRGQEVFDFAPDWVEWYAEDENGDRFWFSREPEEHPHRPGWWQAPYACHLVERGTGPLNLSWRESKICREATQPDYPWHLAPEGTVGAATDEDGSAHWWRGGMPIQDQTYWSALRGRHRLGRIPNFTFRGYWRASWRWMPGKEPTDGSGTP
jgi:hypothetical protein